MKPANEKTKTNNREREKKKKKKKAERTNKRDVTFDTKDYLFNLPEVGKQRSTISNQINASRYLKQRYFSI